MKQIYANNQTLLQLGRQGENLARKVVFDLSSWVSEYGSGVAELIYQRNGDTAPYPVAAAREGNTLVWTLTATDTAVASSYGSNGHCELRYYVGDVLAKSATWPTKVIPAMSTPSETTPPEPEQGWVEQVLATGVAAQQAADAAKADADRAQGVIQDVNEAGSHAVQSVQSAGDAQVKRVAEEGTTQTANAKAQADAAAQSAAGAAQSAQEAAESAAVYGEVVADVTQLKQDIVELSGRREPEYQMLSGAYTSDGTYNNAIKYGRTSPIAVSKGEIVKVNASINSTFSVIATCSSSGDFIASKATSVGSGDKEYFYTVEENGYIFASGLVASPFTINIYDKDSVEMLKGRMAQVESSINYTDSGNLKPIAIHTSHYISNTGAYTEIASGAYSVYGNINLAKGDVLTFSARGQGNNVVAILAEVVTDTVAYNPLIIAEDGLTHDFTFMAPKDMVVCISSQISIESAMYYRITSSKLMILNVEINNAKSDIQTLNNKLYNDCFAFSSIGIIGDSLASGCTNYIDESTGSTVGKDRKEFSWGKWIEREHGIETTLFTDGGANVLTWLTGSFGLESLQNAEVKDAYIIGLGVNDYSKKASLLGSISDITTTVQSVPSEYTSFYELYSNMIALIKEKAPRSKIFCLTMSSYHASKATPKAFNQAIRDVVSAYDSVGNVYLIDLENDSFSKSENFTKYWYLAHSTAIGYKFIGEHLYKLISDYVENHYTDFLDIQWIKKSKDDADE